MACSDPEFRRTYPTLYDFLVLQGVSGVGRKTGTLLTFCEDGKVKGCVTDRDGGYYAFVSSDSFAGLLEAVDRDLKTGALDWRKSKAWKR